VPAIPLDLFGESEEPFEGIVVSDSHRAALDLFSAIVPRHPHRPAPVLRVPGHESRLAVRGRIATGTSGHVYAAQELGTRRGFALKVVPAGPISDEVESRVATLRRFPHPHIVTVVDTFHLSVQRTTFLCVQMEICGKGTLRQVILRGADRKDPLPAATVHRYLSELVDALAFVHEKGVLHGDVRSENILLTWDGDLRLGSFASSTRRVPGIELTITGGFRTFAPPEWQDSVPPHRPLTALEMPEDSYDMWGVGCVLGEMATMRVTYGDRVTHHRALASDPTALTELKHDVSLAHDGLFHPYLVSLLEIDPTDRIDAVTLREELRGTAPPESKPRRRDMPRVLIRRLREKAQVALHPSTTA
jgi:serine/threonine protein kinase